MNTALHSELHPEHLTIITFKVLNYKYFEISYL